MRNVKKHNVYFKYNPNGRGFTVAFKNEAGRNYKWNSGTQTLTGPNGTIKSKMSNVFKKEGRRLIRNELPVKRSESLTVQNKHSHAKWIGKMLSSPETLVFSSRNTKPVKLPEKYLPVVRVGGSTRSADGAAFLLRDKKLVGKIVYYTTDDQLKSILREYEIGKKMGEIGVGPQVMRYYTIHTDYRFQPRNITAYGGATPDAVYIIMENLAYGAVDLQPYWKMPYPDILSKLIEKMRKYGVLHGDLHGNNILVKVAENGRVRVYIIDYGRSIYIPSNTSNIANYMKRHLLHATNSNVPHYLASPGGTYRAPSPLVKVPKVPRKNNNNVNISNVFNDPGLKSHPLAPTPRRRWFKKMFSRT